MNDAALAEPRGEGTTLSLKRNLIAVGGDLIVGSLLSQIVYWFTPTKQGGSKLRIYKHGQYWVAKTREQWMEETCISLKQYKRALSVLKEKGFIEVRMMRFKGITQSHLRLCHETLNNALREVGETAIDCSHLPASVARNCTSRSSKSATNCKVVVPDGPPSVVPSDPPSVVLVGPRITTITTTTTTTPTFGSSPSAPTKTGAKKQKTKNSKRKEREKEEDKEKEVQKGEVETMKAEDVLKKREQRKTEPITLAVGSKKSLPMFWQRRMANLFPDRVLVPLTVAQSSMLKRISRDSGDHVYAVIDWCLNNWWRFASTVAAKTGLSTVPSEPNIAFLTKYREEALNLYLQSIAAPPKPAVQPKPVVSTSYKEPTPAEAPLTVEEVQAELEAFYKEFSS